MVPTQKIKILFVIGNYAMGGKERQLTELIANLSLPHYEIGLIVKNVQEQSYYNRIRERLSFFYAFRKSHFGIRDFIQYRTLICTFRPDYLISFSTLLSHFSLLTKFVSPTFRLINCSIRSAPARLRKIERREAFFYNFYSTVVANSQSGLAAYGQTGKRGRHVLRNCFDFNRIPAATNEQLRTKWGISQDRFVITMLARLDRSKDHATLILAAKECRSWGKDYLFLIVGDGETRSAIEGLIAEHQLDQTVKLVGKQNCAEEFFRLSDLSVLTSTNGEGQSNSIIESLACGCPVIATDFAGNRELVDGHQNGYCVNIGDYQSIAEKIKFLDEHRSERDRLGQNGCEFIRKNFSVKTMITTFEKILNNNS